MLELVYKAASGIWRCAAIYPDELHLPPVTLDLQKLMHAKI